MPNSYGVELFNNRNYVVANANDVNYTLRSAGQIHNWQFNPPNVLSVSAFCGVDLSPYNSPIMFFKPMWNDQRIGCMTGDERDWHAYHLGPTKKMFKVMKWGNKDIGSIQYYIFDRWAPPERSSHGMQLFDSSGNIIFDSGWNFMKIRNVMWLDPGYPNHGHGDPNGGNPENEQNWTMIGAAGPGNLAMAMPNPRGWVTTNWRGEGWMMYECFHFSDWDNKITISLIPRGEYLWTPPNAGWANPNTRSQVMIIDVDGFPTNYYDAKIVPGFTA
ncbi:hypothetical protein RGJ22_003036 [Serratia marcescens]|uniref:hypothetical protein n=1 Tax=Serratia marcescens TaxID=615 RepID=UPI0021786449|nr:hypothetical protein [Serratia marcescens]ELA7783231.1 hypothetical protein [Serratia marcescens]CAI1599634.1 Uncharacterised protein [Serratia marcescens]